MIYVLPTLWIIFSLIIGIVTKSLLYFSYSILYGCLIALISFTVKWIKNAVTYSLYKFDTIDGIISGNGKTKVTAFNRRVGWFMKGTVLTAFFVEYNYLVIKDLNEQSIKVLISEVKSKSESDRVDYELEKDIRLDIAKYNSEYFITKDFWKELNF